jgi:hypothetical protein
MDWLFAYFNSAPITYTFYSILEFHGYFLWKKCLVDVVLIGLFEPQKGKNLKVWNFSLVGLGKCENTSKPVQ